MFRSPAKWRREKNTITVLFKLQFHATQVSEFGGNELVLSVVSAENAKPNVKLEKCVMRENGCYWENPVYETVKFIQDHKTGKILERIYHFIIATQSTNGSVVGEFSVNIADFVGATKACLVSFPFQNSNSDAHLHVLIQRVQENTNQRDVEEIEDLKINPEDRTLRRFFSNDDVEDGVMAISMEDEPLRKTVSHMGLNGMSRGSSGSDITLSSSDTSTGLNTPRETGVRNSNVSKDQMSNGSNYQDGCRTRWDLATVPANDSSTDYSTSSPRDDSVEKLRGDFVALSRRAEMSELELQTLRKQVVKESKRGQDLVKELTALKQERDSLKDECEKLKGSRKHPGDLKVKSKLQFEGDPLILLEEFREELNYEKDKNANLRLQLQKTQESNAELMLAVQDLEEMLENNNKGVSDLPTRSSSGESTLEIEESILKRESSSDDEEQKALEEIVRQHSDAHEAYLLEKKIMDLCSELEMYRRDKDELEMQMEQLALDYEILKQENHEFSSKLQQSHLHEQLKMPYDCSGSYPAISELEAQKEKLQNELNEQSKELSGCLAMIKELEVRNKSLEEELEKQAQGFEADKEAISRAQMEQEERAARSEEALSESNAAVNELRTQKEKLNKELKKLFKEFSGSLATIQEFESRNNNLEERLEKQAEGYEADMEALFHAKMEQEQRALQAEEALARSNATLNELESHIEQLENELKKHSEESSDTLTTIKELEGQIQNLEDELEKQAEGFEADLEAVSHAKVEEEQRAIRAEEALKLMRWKNANAAARIQDEFKRLSSQMQSSFEANEKLSRKAFTEASELRMHNRYLQNVLQKANEELQSAKDDYETKLQELYSQIEINSTRVEQMAGEIEEKSKQHENQKRLTNEFQKSVSEEQSVLKAEIERLNNENKSLTEQAKEAEKLRSEMEDMKIQIKQRDRQVAGRSLEELDVLRSLKDEKEQTVVKLQSEMESLRAQCEELKRSIYEDELEKEKLRKQMFQLKADLKKKDEAISSLEKKFKDKSRATPKSTKCEPVQRGSKEGGSKEVVTLKERVKLLEKQIKSKDTALETSANAFLSKETNLNGKIEELESRLKELGESSPGSGIYRVKEGKVSVGMQVDCSEEVTSAGDLPEEANSIAENLKDSNGKTSSDTGSNASEDIYGEQQQKFDILLKEMVSLKETNKSMESELKEMEERYSDLSLKFAEVEGERQQLVMNLRNLKNAKKT